MGQHRDLKINYDGLSAIQSVVKQYIDALEDLQESTNAFANVIKAQEGDAFDELDTEFEEDISVDYSSLIGVLNDVYTNIGNYMTDMTSYIAPEDSSALCRVDRNDIWWNLQQIRGIPYGYFETYPGVPSHWYMDEFVNPFADDADEVRARNAERARRRERNYDKLNNFFNNSLRTTADDLWNETESIKSIYDNYVIEYENTDDIYSAKMQTIYYSIASLLDLIKDEVDTRVDFLRGFCTGFVDLLKGLKAPLEIALAISPTIPLPPGVRAALLIDGTNEIYQGVKVFINDPENTIGAMFQGMFDTGDEEGTAFCVGYATEKIAEVIIAKKLAEKLAGPKVTEGPQLEPDAIQVGKSDLDALRNKLGVPETDTIAVGKTNVKGLDNLTFEGQSPKVRVEAGLPDIDDVWAGRNIKSPGKNPLFTRHAEEVLVNDFDRAVIDAGLNPRDVSGVLKIHQSNPSGVCRKCIQGLANDKVSPGVLKQLSMKYPNLRIEVTSEISQSVKITGKSSFIIQNGVYVK